MKSLISSIIKEIASFLARGIARVMGILCLGAMGALEMAGSFYWNYHAWLSGLQARGGDGAGMLFFYLLYLIASLLCFAILFQLSITVVRMFWPDAPGLDSDLDSIFDWFIGSSSLR